MTREQMNKSEEARGGAARDAADGVQSNGSGTESMPGLAAWAHQQKAVMTAISAWGEEAARFYQKRMAAQAELLNAMRDVHGPTQWMELQARFTRAMADDYVSEAQTMVAIGQQAVTPPDDARA